MLVGINYDNGPASTKLRGCINDIVRIKNVLIKYYGYLDQNIVMLRDDAAGGGQRSPNYPSGQNIWSNLCALVTASITNSTGTNALQEIFVYYSGHGSRMTNLDSVIVPADYAKAGVIPDRYIVSVLKCCRCRALTFWDSCNSGTVCDLPFTFTYNPFVGSTALLRVNNLSIANAQIVSLSGCKDSQTSADAYDTTACMFDGAFTTAFLQSLAYNNYTGSLYKIYQDTCRFLNVTDKFSQNSVYSCSTNNPSTITLTQTKAAAAVAVRSVINDVVAATATAASTASKPVLLPSVAAAATAPRSSSFLLSLAVMDVMPLAQIEQKPLRKNRWSMF